MLNVQHQLYRDVMAFIFIEVPMNTPFSVIEQIYKIMENDEPEIVPYTDGTDFMELTWNFHFHMNDEQRDAMRKRADAITGVLFEHFHPSEPEEFYSVEFTIRNVKVNSITYNAVTGIDDEDVLTGKKRVSFLDMMIRICEEENEPTNREEVDAFLNNYFGLRLDIYGEVEPLDCGSSEYIEQFWNWREDENEQKKFKNRNK